MAVRESIEVAVPAQVAYEQLCRIEEYPRFHHDVRRVTPLSETDARWECATGDILVRITDRTPDTLLRWQALTGPSRAQTVVVEALPSGRARVTVESVGPRPDLQLLREYLETGVPGQRPAGNERPVRVAGSNWRDARMAEAVAAIRGHLANERPGRARGLRNSGPPPAGAGLFSQPHNGRFGDDR